MFVRRVVVIVVVIVIVIAIFVFVVVSAVRARVGWWMPGGACTRVVVMTMRGGLGRGRVSRGCAR